MVAWHTPLIQTEVFHDATETVNLFAALLNLTPACDAGTHERHAGTDKDVRPPYRQVEGTLKVM